MAYARMPGPVGYWTQGRSCPRIPGPLGIKNVHSDPNVFSLRGDIPPPLGRQEYLASALDRLEISASSQ
jgi:hypothetical protein